MNDLKQRLTNMSPEQRALFQKQLKEKALAAASQQKPEQNPEQKAAVKPSCAFSLFYFSGDGSAAEGEKYDLLLKSAKFADENGFVALWTPERHFQEFGGLYPNPSVLSAALAVTTRHVQLRAGSIALPLHHPVRVAEEWAVVDNLSNGRVALGIATGWHQDDFLVAPEPTEAYFHKRKQKMYENLEQVRRLWRGGPVEMRGIDGALTTVQLMPKPIQKELDVWIAVSGSPTSYVQVGEAGANLVTSMVGQPIAELKKRIQSYREARARAGFDPETGVVTVMMHTYIGEDNETLKEQVRAPLTNYLRTFLKQFEHLAAQFEGVTENDKETLLHFIFERYFETGTLLGTVDKCTAMIDELIAAGVNEVACLIDFGVDSQSVLEGLDHLKTLKQRYEQTNESGRVYA